MGATTTNGRLLHVDDCRPKPLGLDHPPVLMNARFIYKCRRCGKCEESSGMSGTRGVLITQLMKTTESLDITNLHACDDDRTDTQWFMGVSDLIGMRVTEDHRP